MVQTAQTGRKLARRRARKAYEEAEILAGGKIVSPVQFVNIGVAGTGTTWKEETAQPTPDAENLALIALLQQWREEDAGMSEEEAEQADRDLAEFKANMNANRAATGERPVYR